VKPGLQVSANKELSLLLPLYGHLQSHLHLVVGHLHLQSHLVRFGPASPSDQWVGGGRLVVVDTKLSGNSIFPFVILVGLLIFKVIINSTPELEISFKLFAVPFFVFGEHFAFDLLISTSVLLYTMVKEHLKLVLPTRTVWLIVSTAR